MAAAKNAEEEKKEEEKKDEEKKDEEKKDDENKEGDKPAEGAAEWNWQIVYWQNNYYIQKSIEIFKGIKHTNTYKENKL